MAIWFAAGALFGSIGGAILTAYAFTEEAKHGSDVDAGRRVFLMLPRVSCGGVHEHVA